MTTTEKPLTLPVDVRSALSEHLHSARFRGLALNSLRRQARTIARNELGLDRLNKPLAAAVDDLATKVSHRAQEGGRQGGVAERLNAHLLGRFSEEIERRGGETAIEESARSIELSVIARRPFERLVLLGADGWRQHSRSFGARRASLRYLCGVDDNGPWAVRVPGTVESIAEAAAWIEPAAVAKARAAGRRVLRQGDVYVVERGRGADDFSDLPQAHEWDAATRTLSHHPEDGRRHRPLEVPFTARAYVQRAYEMGRSGRVGRFAD